MVGPRQCGKTNLAREFVGQDSINYFDREDPTILARPDDRKLALEPLDGLVDIIENVVMIRAFRPWHKNLKKRQVKGLKIYFRDSGLFHSLIGIRDPLSVEWMKVWG